MSYQHWVKVTINDLNPVLKSFLLRQFNRVSKFRDIAFAIRVIKSASKRENIVVDDLTRFLQTILLDGTWILSNFLHLSRLENRNAIQLLRLLLEKNSPELEIDSIPEGSADLVQLEGQSSERHVVKFPDCPAEQETWFHLGNFVIICLTLYSFISCIF
jgi:hypothetical protein